MKMITRFRGDYRFLSNFYTAPFVYPFVYNGITYQSVEHAYQSMKTDDPERQKYIREAPTASESAKRGRSKDTVLKPNWLEIKGDVMRSLVVAKFSQNTDLVEKLVKTENAILIEGNYWHDNYFGVCSCSKCYELQGVESQNILGEILMDIRKYFSLGKY